MKPQTKRQQAEIIVAMVRAEFPHCAPRSALLQGPCVGDAYYQFREAHPEMKLPVLLHRDNDGCPVHWYDSGGHFRFEEGSIPRSIYTANDVLGPSRAWPVLADELEKVL